MSSDNNQNKMDDVSARIKKAQLDSFKRQIDESYNELVASKQNNRLPESLFKKEFLPFFSGKDTGDKDLNEIVSTWISISGTPTAELDIFDDSTGDTLFTVPGIFNSGVIDVVNRSKSSSLNNIYATHALGMAHIPHVADNVLLKTLDEKVKTMLDPESVEDPRWKDIIDRYSNNSSSTVNSKSKPLAVDDDLIYD